MSGIDSNTQLTYGLLKQNIEILEKIISACKGCLSEPVSWSESCRKSGIDALKARSMMLNLPKCLKEYAPLSDYDFENDGAVRFYDAYEEFYRHVFGDRSMKSSDLPYDHAETVRAVLEDTGLSQRDADIVMRRFGICDYDVPETLESIAGIYGLSGDRVRQIEAKFLRKCRYAPRRDMLMKGIAEYRLAEKNNAELHALRMENIAKEHAALMEKEAAEAADALESMGPKSYAEAVAGTLPDGIVDILGSTDMAELCLDVRSHNALRRNGRETVLQVLRLDFDDPVAKNSIYRIRNMGARSAADVKSKLEEYVAKRWGISVDALLKAHPAIKARD